MPFINHELVILTNDSSLKKCFQDNDPFLLSTSEIKQLAQTDLLFIDSRLKIQNDDLLFLANLKKQQVIKKIIMVLFLNNVPSPDSMILLGSDHYIFSEKLSTELLHHYLSDIRQQEQDETYLHLSVELNQQYEILRNELEKKLTEKSQNLVESRKQIYEINNRVELLRKSLYTTSEIKNIEDAEKILTDLLVPTGILTWVRIVPANLSLQFENDLNNQFSSTFFKCSIKLPASDFFIFFFKGDRRSFRKADTNYFKKIAETLQLNLNRHADLLSLQQSERLFDLAFHSSPHPIVVINDHYQVLQANLAAEKKSEDDRKIQSTCYSLLFKRDTPCTHCKLGQKFQVQQEHRFFSVQSNKLSSSGDNKGTYWMQFYEDISEQQTLESKFQQTARLSELGLISSSIAHELNNPLGGIISYLQIMKLELPSEHKFQEDLVILSEAAHRMKKHIEDLLYFSRKEDPLKKEPLDLIDLFQKNLDLMQMQFKKEQLHVSFVTQSTLVLEVSHLHFRNMIHLVFQFLLNKLRIKKQNKTSFRGLVEVKFSRDQMNTYLSFAANLGPHDTKLNTNDLSLITLEKSILDQGFQLVITEPQPYWLQLLINLGS